MKARITNNVIPFRRSQALSRFNVIPQEWRVLVTGEGKKLSEKELQTLWTLYRSVEHHQTDQLVIDYAFLIYQCGFECSQRQMSRYLNAIKSTKIISYKTQNAAHGYKKKIHIQLDYNILENLMTNRYDGQVCRSNMVRYNIDKNKLQSKELSSFSKKKELNSLNLTTCAREEKEQHKKLSADLLSFPSGAANHADQHKETPEIQTQKNEKEKPMQVYNWEDPAIKLNLAISQNFDIATATTLTVDIDYRYHKTEETMQLILKQKLAISEEHKNRLRQLIRGIYGDDTKIVQPDPKLKKAFVAKKAHNQEKISSIEQKPPEIGDFNDKPLMQKVITNLIEDGIERVLIDRWFNPTRIKISEEENQITFKCSDFIADQIINRFISSLTQSCKELGLELIFLAKNMLDEIKTIKVNEKGRW